MTCDRGARLKAECARVDGVPVTWGVDDCSTWPAQWVASETGVELDWPSFDSEETAKSVIDGAGGLREAWQSVAHQAELIKTRDPEVGDVGIVEHPSIGQFGVIFLHGGAAVWRAGTGVRFLPVRRKVIFAAWEVPWVS